MVNDDEEIEEELSESDIRFIIGRIEAGTTVENEAEKVLREIYCRINRRTRYNWDLSGAMWEFLAFSLKRYFKKGQKTKSLDAAFGLKRGKGRPSFREAHHIAMAADVEARRSQSESYDEATHRVAEKYGTTQPNVKKIYKKHRSEGLIAHMSARLSEKIAKRAKEPSSTKREITLKGGRKITMREP